jgi:hypothetical protein
MKAPEWGNAPYRYPWLPLAKPAAPTLNVYPLDDEVKEGLLGPDGKPVTEGKRRKNPIGFHRQDDR